MARIVITTWGSYGDVFPFIGLGLALAERKHRPVLAMPPVYRELVEREGLEFSPTRPDVAIHDRQLAAKVMDPAKGPEVIFRDVLIPALRDAHADLMDATAGADLLITHPATPAGPIVADERRMPWVSTVLAPMSFFSASDPIAPPPAPWIQPILARSHAASKAFLWLTDRLTQRWAEPIQRLRVERGLPAGANPIMAGQHSPRLVLALFSRVLAEPQADWPAQVQVVGPSLYNGPETTMPPALAAFLREGPAPVVFTLGTSAVAAAGRFYQISAEAVERLGMRAVLLAGPFQENRPARTPPGVYVAEFAPHAAVFAHAAVIVHQGGAGTLHQGLVSGRPMLVVPHSHDQPDNARRVTRLGVARTLFPTRYTVPRLSDELRRLMEPSFAQRATDVAKLVRAEAGLAGAVDAIEAVLHERPI